MFPHHTVTVHRVLFHSKTVNSTTVRPGLCLTLATTGKPGLPRAWPAVLQPCPVEHNQCFLPCSVVKPSTQSALGHSAAGGMGPREECFQMVAAALGSSNALGPTDAPRATGAAQLAEKPAGRDAQDRGAAEHAGGPQAAARRMCKESCAVGESTVWRLKAPRKAAAGEWG